MSRRRVVRASWTFLLITFPAFASLPLPCRAQDDVDLEQEAERLRPRLVVGDDARILIVAAGTAGLAISVDSWIRDLSQKGGLQDSGVLQDVFAGTSYLGGSVPVYSSLALYGLASLSGQDRLRDASGHVAGAVLSATVVATFIKVVSGRSRPYVPMFGDNGELESDADDTFHLGHGIGYGKDYRSFPSGHTAAAFAIATALGGELRYLGWDDSGWIGRGLWVTAGATGLSRIYHDRHWTSDVVAGAAVGLVAGRVFTRTHRPASVPSLFIEPGEESGLLVGVRMTAGGR